MDSLMHTPALARGAAMRRCRAPDQADALRLPVIWDSRLDVVRFHQGFITNDYSGVRSLNLENSKILFV